MIAIYDYAGGVMVGVRGKHWYLSIFNGKPSTLTVTDPQTGERRQYDPYGKEKI